MEAILFNIQKFSVHDGPGVRTTLFFKGCPLDCAWCHNPEGKGYKPQILYDSNECQGCGACIEICPVNRIVLSGQTTQHDPDIVCAACGKCADICIHSARKLAGQSFSIDDLMDIILADQVFYEESSGGVTFSGGEALCQIKAVTKLARQCQKKGVHVAIDTCGHVPFEYFETILPYTDLFLYDIKAIDPSTHQKYTKVSNQLILENLKKLSRAGAKISLRLPIIAEEMMSKRYIESIIKTIIPLKINQVHLLGYHGYGYAKNQMIDLETHVPFFNRPDEEFLQTAKNLFENNGYEVTIGG
jgi:pyruvate formate lyase activating enzyme